MLSLHDVRDRLRIILCQSLQLDVKDLIDDLPFLKIATSSLALVDAFSRIATEFGVKPSLRQIFHEHGSLEKLAPYVHSLIAEAERDGHGPMHRAALGAVLPFTPAMAWRQFLSQLQPGPAWIEVAVVQLRGKLDEARLAAAWQTLIQRHESLRARVVTTREGEEPISGLTIEPAASEALHALALSVAWADCSRPEAVSEWMKQSPVLRVEHRLAAAELYRLNEEQALLRLSLSHLIADRAALGMVLSELGQLYQQKTLPKAPSLAEWMAKQLGAAEEESLAHWWCEQLRGRTSTDLPADKSRPAVKRYTGRRLIVPLPKDLWADEKGSLFGSYLHTLSAFALLMARLCGWESLTLGVSSTPLTEARGLLANRENPLALPLELDLDAPFSTLKDQVRMQLFEAIDHAALPFSKVISALQPERDQGRSPIFTVAFEHHVLPALQFSDLETSWITPPGGGARVDLQLTLVDGPGISQLQVDYDDALFSADTVRRWMGSLRRLLTQTTSPHPARSLPLWSAEEEAALLALGRGPSVPLDATPLHIPFFKRAARNPSGLALCWKNQRLDNATLSDWALRVGARLEALEVAPGDRVGICLERRPEAIAALLGVLSMGGVYVPLDPAYPPVRIASTAADAGLSLILTDADTAFPAELSVKIERLQPGLAGLQERLATPYEPNQEELAYLIYTSGTTGQPKGVAIPHRAARNLVLWAQSAFSAEELQGVLASTSFCFDLSVYEIFVTLSSEGTVVLVDNALSLAELADSVAVTLINTVPSAMAELLRRGPLPSSLQVVNLAGEPLRRRLVDRIYEQPAVKKVFNLYGPSETTTYSTWGLAARGTSSEPTIGRPVGNTSIVLWDRGGALTPPGGVGEIVIGGAGVASGYFEQPSRSAERFMPDPQAPGCRVYCTGDFGRFLPDGQLQFLGRRDAQMKVRGFRIELGAIETALEAHPIVREAVVQAQSLPGEEGEKRLIAWLSRKPEVLVIHTPDFRAWLSQRLPPFMVPAVFVELPALPRNANGKVDRAALPVPDFAREARVAGEYVAPGDDLERVLAGIWERQLGISRVGIHDDFFSLGGDSLLLSSTVLEIKARLGVRLSLAEFFACTTISRLSARVRELARDRVNRTMVRRRIARTGPEVDALFAKLEQDGKFDAPALSAKVQGTKLTELFVTGVTGFVGAHTFYELLTRTPLRFAVLVRCRTPEEGRKRVQDALASYGLLPNKPNDFAERFRVIPGDLGLPNLGLSPKVWESLAGNVDAVLHMAALVNFLYPYHALKTINVDGVREVLRLCFAGRPKPLHYMSTAALWPMGAHLSFREDQDIHHGIRLNLGYDESKWVAELLINQARAAGLPVSIYRPGEVSGHSRTGQCVLDHFMFAIMKGSIQLGVFLDVKGLIDMAPVDYVAQATAALLQDPSTLGGTFQLNNPNPGVPAEMLKFLHDYGYRFTLQPMEEWVTTLTLRADLSENALYPFMAILEEFEEENLQFPRYDTTLAQAALKPLGVHCPPVREALLSTYLDWFVKVGFLPPPTRTVSGTGPAAKAPA